jgi:hypothetical protein
MYRHTDSFVPDPDVAQERERLAWEAVEAARERDHVALDGGVAASPRSTRDPG